MKNNFHQYMVHFDNFGEFDQTLKEFCRKMERESGMNWRLTPAGIDMIQFCEKYYPNWWKITIKQL